MSVTGKGRRLRFEQTLEPSRPQRAFFFLLTLFVPAVGFSLLVVMAMALNNQRLHPFAENLFQHPLPPHTTIIEQRAEVTLLGNSNHCDFVVEQTLETKLSVEEIGDFYKDLTLPAVANDSPSAVAGQIPIQLLFENSRLPDDKYHFTVALYDMGYPAGLDWRCH